MSQKIPLLFLMRTPCARSQLTLGGTALKAYQISDPRPAVSSLGILLVPYRSQISAVNASVFTRFCLSAPRAVVLDVAAY